MSPTRLSPSRDTSHSFLRVNILLDISATKLRSCFPARRKSLCDSRFARDHISALGLHGTTGPNSSSGSQGLEGGSSYLLEVTCTACWLESWMSGLDRIASPCASSVPGSSGSRCAPSRGIVTTDRSRKAATTRLSMPSKMDDDRNQQQVQQEQDPEHHPEQQLHPEQQHEH